MTEAQLLDAIEQMKAHCKLVIETEGYGYLSVRGTAYTLGYNDEEVEQIIDKCRAGGFKNCLDYRRSNNDGESYPAQSVCEWGADQLLSRLDALFFMTRSNKCLASEQQ